MLLVFIITFTLIMGLSTCSFKKKEVVWAAKEYLKITYKKEMVYLDFRFSFIDPSMYHVSFCPVDNNELEFEVLVQTDLAIPQRREKEDGGFFTPDNYLLKIFGISLEKYFNNEVQRIWGKDIRIVVTQNKQPLYSFYYPIGIHEGMTFDEMEPLLDYDIYFDINTEMKKIDIVEESIRIFRLIEIINQYGYTPREINFCYKKPKDGRLYVSFNNLETVTLDMIKELFK